MSAIQKNPLMTEEEFLAFERASETKHEFFKGEIFAMAGASREHNAIAQSLSHYIYPQGNENRCEGYGSDMRLKVLATGLLTYPDFAVYCGDLLYTGDKPDTVTNPTVIFEILSPSTEIHDRNTKFRHFQQIPSLQEYVLISQDSPRIESFLRQANGKWVYTDVNGLDKQIEFPSIGAILSLANIYERVEFPPAQE